MGKGLDNQTQTNKENLYFIPEIFGDMDSKCLDRFINNARKGSDILITEGTILGRKEKTGLKNGLLLYSMWNGYRDSNYQRGFEKYLITNNFTIHEIHTSGHASRDDIIKLITQLKPHKIIPILTMNPDVFMDIADNVILLKDGQVFEAYKSMT